MARGERVERLDRRLVAQTVSEQRGGLLRAHQRAREDLVDLHAEPREPFDCLLEPVDALFREGTLRVVRPLLTAVGGNRVADDVEVAGFHV